MSGCFSTEKYWGLGESRQSRSMFSFVCIAFIKGQAKKMYLDIVEFPDLKQNQQWCIDGGEEFGERECTWVLLLKGGGRDWSEQIV